MSTLIVEGPMEHRAGVPPEWSPREPGTYDRIKRLADLTLGIILLIVTLPLASVAWVLVRLTSRGPGIYSQLRVGLNGCVFRIYKLRTMRHNCEAVTGPCWSVKGDPRVTPLGRWLRRTHVDELPQLWNVIRGHMSLVGPRPERPEIVRSLDRAVAGYSRRLSVRPGLTGLAQIQLPADTSINSVRRKLALDLCYIARQGASLDLRILLGTALYLVGVSYGGIRRSVALPQAWPPVEISNEWPPPAPASGLPEPPQALVSA
jgi:lipopolysaccharide/colanic/teichoic acid biosynthesis glycosyltransferase